MAQVRYIPYNDIVINLEVRFVFVVKMGSNGLPILDLILKFLSVIIFQNSGKICRCFFVCPRLPVSMQLEHIEKGFFHRTQAGGGQKLL